MKHSPTHTYRTAGGVQVHRASVGVEYNDAAAQVIAALDARPGVLLSSTFDYPGRYTRWDIGFVDPPLRISASGRRLHIEALNARGEVLLQLCQALVEHNVDVADISSTPRALAFSMRAPEPVVVEEQRTRQRSVFTFLRQLLTHFASREDEYLGLYGAFGYELAFQFEAIRPHLQRDDNARDLVLYLPDTLVVVDHRRETAQQLYYDFAFTQGSQQLSTRHLPRSVEAQPFVLPIAADRHVRCDHPPGAYDATVRKALAYFARGDLFEAVPGQTFFKPCQDSPARIFRRLQQQNPAPYGALLNLGRQEYLVGASPEMFVRVEGRRVETCPISGTIARGRDAIEDAQQIRTLLNSAKDEAELSMCTDVDRNDKARVCEPGSIKVLGRRQVELYSRLIHTVDHVEGRLQPQFDALDAFLAHAWAVTVTGAPKQAAIQFIEDHEMTPRSWYGGALGCLNFNGNLNTGLTIRTMCIRDGSAEVRAGATLLIDSDPAAEEAETRLKAAALLGALDLPTVMKAQAANALPGPSTLHPAEPLRILMVDHQDSFVHMLACCFREAGAAVVTVRPAGVAAMLEQVQPQLVVLSPGPGRPADFKLSNTLAACVEHCIPVFGVCLGLQGIVEHFGGTLRTLAQPVHGRQSQLVVFSGPLFAGIQQPLQVGRYHSLAADQVPDCLEVCARAEDGCVMAVQHRELPISAVQFHPESLLSLHADNGRQLIRNVCTSVGAQLGDALRKRYA